ncbi:calsenilin-like isoform X1 [Nannospalax galili]|uniref:calsenilin-like isoform X1 n=1 Tax=Nannospalax galili TaxID=1026970 RepID=UPI0004ED2456|nr:calsenilin-like isoform X1 [Nannospalax galili]
MQRAKEAMKASDGSLLGDTGHTQLSKKEGIKWQRPRFTRQALMRCCLVKWILSSAAPQGSESDDLTDIQDDGLLDSPVTQCSFVFISKSLETEPHLCLSELCVK